MTDTRHTGPSIYGHIALVVGGGIVAGLCALALWRGLGAGDAVVVRFAAGRVSEPDWGKHSSLTPDPVAGFRPKCSIEVEFPMAALDDSLRLSVRKRRDSRGFLRAVDLPDELAGRRVLALGDSHLDGVVSTAQNLTSIVEESLRKDTGGEHWVLNAGCGLYTLYQYALRARTLVPRYRPDVVLAVVFCGNDFGELDNTGFPHLDDELAERASDPEPRPEETSRRLRALDLFVDAPFWQGMNQALYLHEEPERVPVIQRKAARSVELLEQTARNDGAKVLWVLVPSFDLVFPDKIASASDVAREVVESGVQLGLHDWFRDFLQERGSHVVDMLPVFLAEGSIGIYAIDFHIFVRGHELVADEVLRALRRLLPS